MCFTALGRARYRRCYRCCHRLMRPGAGWRYSHCDYGGGDLELAGAFLDGPDGNCPAGFWDGLAPVEGPSKAESQAQDRLVFQRFALKPAIMAALECMPDRASWGGFLERLVADGLLELALAEECAEEGGLDLDTP